MEKKSPSGWEDKQTEQARRWNSLEQERSEWELQWMEALCEQVELSAKAIEQAWGARDIELEVRKDNGHLWPRWRLRMGEESVEFGSAGGWLKADAERLGEAGLEKDQQERLKETLMRVSRRVTEAEPWLRRRLEEGDRVRVQDRWDAESVALAFGWGEVASRLAAKALEEQTRPAGRAEASAPRL